VAGISGAGRVRVPGAAARRTRARQRPRRRRVGRFARRGRAAAPQPARIEYILVSPAQHQVHHSQAEKHWDNNFSTLFAFCDVMFGTWHLSELKRVTIGLQNGRGSSLSFFASCARRVEGRAKPAHDELWSAAALVREGSWWAVKGSNLRHPRCKREDQGNGAEPWGTADAESAPFS
jgi:hypothetical protein